MKLCKHIQPIYEAEIKSGNTAVSVETSKKLPCKLGVHMQKAFRDDHQTELVRDLFRSPHYPVVYRYFCEECGCLLDSPLPYKSCEWTPGENAPCDMRAVATEQNVYAEDGVFEQGMKPTSISEAQKVAYDRYWAAYPDEKAALQAAGERLRKQYFRYNHDACREAEEAVYQAVNRLRALETERAALSVFAVRKRRAMEQEERTLSEALPSLRAKEEEARAKIQAEQAEILQKQAFIDRMKCLLEPYDPEKL